MKVVLTVHQFFPDYFSGTEVLTYSVAVELVRRGHEVIVYTGFPSRSHLRDHQRFDQYELDGIRVHRFHHAYVRAEGQESTTEVEYNNLLAAGYFARLLRDERPDIVHFFHFGRLTAALIDVSTAAGIPSFYTPTDFWGVCPTSQLLLPNGRTCGGPTAHGGNCVKHVAALTRGGRIAKYGRWIPDIVADAVLLAMKAGLAPDRYRRPEAIAMSRRRPFIVERLNALQGIVAPTSLMTEVLTRNGVVPSLIVNSAYGIDLKGFKPRTRTAVRQSDALTIGFIGTLAPHKGCHVLLEAFKRLPAGRATLHIFGNPADFPDYFQTLEASAAGNPGIQFRGTFPNAKVAEVLDGIDVLVVPSLWFENTPLVVYSALASRVPVIASDFPGMSEVIVNGHNGLLFSAGNSGRLAQELRKLLEEEDLLPRLSAACRPPKSSVQYTQELLQLWQGTPRRQPLPRLQTIEPFEVGEGDGFIVGWAVVDLKPPRSITMYVNGAAISSTWRFTPRLDVREYLRAGGSRVSDASFGFELVFPSGTYQAAAEIGITSATGVEHKFALRECPLGASIAVGKGALFGLDAENFDTRESAVQKAAE